MKITQVTATPVNIPLRAPYRFALGSTASVTKTIVEVTTDEGLTGIGEGCRWGYVGDDRGSREAARRA